MNDPTHEHQDAPGQGRGQPAGTGPEERLTALFAGMVMQQTNLALMLLGATPHPESGQTLHDLDGARMFIDQLEMLQAKTRGNLSAQEEKLLNQSLMTLRLAFVEAVDHPQSAADAGVAPAADTSPAPPAPAAPGGTPAEAPAPSPDDEGRKKFSKKY